MPFGVIRAYLESIVAVRFLDWLQSWEFIRTHLVERAFSFTRLGEVRAYNS